ncbi:MAG: DNA-binding transcriptional LysR family regulator [Gammaproteobacteria bacterium]|jgi:DNA-binding transcriptional LysR family regulator
MSSVLDIDSMRAFCQTVEMGGVTRAAIKLNLSQSAVSHKLKRLENRLECRLFVRQNGQLKMTLDGEKLLEYAQRLVKLHDEAYASFHQSELSGELGIGITEDITAPGMAQILSNFSHSFPQVSLVSRVSHTPELLRWLNNGEIDMALIEVFESEVLETDQPLGRQQIDWVMAEDFIYDPDQPIPFVTYHKDCFYKAWAEQALKKQGQQLRVVFECPSVEGMINAVRSGLGIGLVNVDAMEHRVASRRGLVGGRNRLPQPPPIQHVARFLSGIPTEQMDKLLEVIKNELVQD